MRVVLSTYGSRGDVEPLAALAVRLRELGADAVVCAPPDEDFVELLERVRVPLVAAGLSVKDMLAEVARQQAELERPRPHAEVIREQARRMVATQYDAVMTAGGDVVLATGLMPAVCGARSAADQLGMRYTHVFLQQTTIPNPDHPPHEYPGRPLPSGRTIRQLWDEHDRETMNQLFGASFAEHRAGVGLPPVENLRDYVNEGTVLLAADPVLAPTTRPNDMTDVLQTGAWILPDGRPLPAGLEAFLDDGEPPVYVGFGSMQLNAWGDAARVAVEAVRSQGRRIVTARGWAALAPDEGFVVGEVNQQALFARCAAVVHHGGAGTTTTAARAGVPQVIVPQVVDQPVFAARVAELGIGVAHDGPVATAESLSAALKNALTPGTAERAWAFRSEIRTDGTTVAAGFLGIS